jgi:hypothetical protein
MKTTRLFLSFAGLLTAAIAYGEENGGSTFPQPAQSPPIAYRHASTLQEGIRRGAADMIRAAGEYNYNTAAAALIFEEARKANFGNRLYYAETYWAKKSLYEQQLATRKTRRLEATIAKPAVEPVKLRLPLAPIDPGQPGFVWPAAFEHPAFAASRQRVTALFAERTPDNSGPGSQSYLRIVNTTAEMKSLLSDLIREMPPMAYVEARGFLDRLAHEAGQPAVLKVAVNN